MVIHIGFEWQNHGNSQATHVHVLKCTYFLSGRCISNGSVWVVVVCLLVWFVFIVFVVSCPHHSFVVLLVFLLPSYSRAYKYSNAWLFYETKKLEWMRRAITLCRCAYGKRDREMMWHAEWSIPLRWLSPPADQHTAPHSARKLSKMSALNTKFIDLFSLLQLLLVCFIHWKMRKLFPYAPWLSTHKQINGGD